MKKLTLQDKMRLLCGRNSWELYNANGELPEVFMSDGPHGLRMADGENGAVKSATAMPNLHMLANSWDPELAFLEASTIADDCIEFGADVLLAPGVNMKRTPLCGRNFEYFSEDPFLAGKMAKMYIEGLQSKGVGAVLKHFCANNREFDRLFQTSEVDERTLREIYLPAFEIALEAKPWAVMSAYNPLNGVYAAENEWLMKGVLREEFGFDGLIMSDWDAAHHSARMVKATVDLRMPYADAHMAELQEGLDSGFITEQEITERAENILRFIERAKKTPKKISLTKVQRHENAVKIARESIVLLKNEEDILPLKGGNIVVTGSLSAQPCYGGGGSAKVTTDYKCKSMEEELRARIGDAGSVSGTSVIIGDDKDPLMNFGLKRGYKSAYGKDAVIIFAGTGYCESEAHDRTSLRLDPLQENYICEMSRYNKNIIVVLNSGSAVDVSAWIDKVKALVLLGFAGEGAQEALADILTGRACPCGKLAETFPISLDDTPVGRGANTMVDRYKEGLFIGYRWYDTSEKEVAFPFGYGLSYARFDYSNLVVTKQGETDYEVSFTVKNISQTEAKEVVQLYVRDVFAMVERPFKELKGFQKVFLKPGESKTVQMKLQYRSFAYYNVAMKKWHVENGDFEILVGASSRDIRLRASIVIDLPFETQNSLFY